MDRKRIRISIDDIKQRDVLLKAIDALPDNTIVQRPRRNGDELEAIVEDNGYIMFNMLHRDYAVQVPSEATHVLYLNREKSLSFDFSGMFYVFRKKK